MPAKDYQIAVSPLTGTVFITKISKTNKSLMLSDRVEFPKNHFYQIIEQFAKANIAEGYSTLEVKDSKGKLVFDLCLPNPKFEKRKKFLITAAISVSEQCESFLTEVVPDDTKSRIMPFIDSLMSYINELTKE